MVPQQSGRPTERAVGVRSLPVVGQPPESSSGGQRVLRKRADQIVHSRALGARPILQYYNNVSILQCHTVQYSGWKKKIRVVGSQIVQAQDDIYQTHVDGWKFLLHSKKKHIVVGVSTLDLSPISYGEAGGIGGDPRVRF